MKVLEPLSVFKFLNTKERTVFLGSLVVRLLLVSLDLFGIILLGITVSLATDNTMASNSISGQISNGFGLLLGNHSAVSFAIAAVAFFAAKAAVSLFMNKFTFDFIAKVESRLVGKSFITVAESGLAKVTKMQKKDISFNFLDSFDYAFSKTFAALSIVAGEAFLIIGVLVYLINLDVLLTLFTIVFFGCVFIAMNYVLGKQTKDAASALKSSATATNEAAMNLIDNFRQLSILAKQKYFERKFLTHREQYSKSNSKISQISVLPRYIVETALVAGFAILLAFQQPSQLGPTPPAILTIFVAGCFRIVASLLPLQGSIGVLSQATTLSRPARNLLEETLKTHEIRESIKKKITETPWALEIHNLGFQFPDSDVWQFRNLSLKVPAGGLLVIKGRSGAGKSTLADLTLGLQEPSQGVILLTGSDGDPAPPKSCEQISYVPQQTLLFTGSILENVALEPHSKADVVKVKKALYLAGLTDTVDAMESGIETLVGPGNIQLSGGQTQRIGIARALYNEPKLLVLDESTSALDKESATNLHKTLENLKQRTTLVAISHSDEFEAYADLTLDLDNLPNPS
jgi:ABC-type multidrug transport system fused ATPase/permease subunit